MDTKGDFGETWMEVKRMAENHDEHNVRREMYVKDTFYEIAEGNETHVIRH